MNNRLLELAQEAEMSANLGNAIDIKLMMNNYAMLIVKECAKIALGDSGLGDYKRARESAMADILNHFEIAKIENLNDKTWMG